VNLNHTSGPEDEFATDEEEEEEEEEFGGGRESAFAPLDEHADAAAAAEDLNDGDAKEDDAISL
jgi:hypothetical protein